MYIIERMSCCPSVKCRNIGSGYVKPESNTCKELEKTIQDKMSERSLQDAKYFPHESSTVMNNSVKVLHKSPEHYNHRSA